ncbi:hybrid sensor histidine kinase/response regulator [Candidatus Uabimicrobium amorphum]|uniref:histidine kinase n=1 Tax=Uabimicrobium amorphum TaxID=2596890 RepID=A0A5S9F0W1_UABAM|nr:response regulator [Candidatus Uabimicrobium amorphum]BBM82025.1 histidine kinase [Candidatus Uabimicrobium amorphum]
MTSLNKANVLLVEDDVGLARLIQKQLQRMNYIVEIAFEGTKALSMVSEGSYDVLLVDQHIPEISGLKIVEKVAAKHPTIMVTGTGNEKIAVAALKAGAVDYIVKDSSSAFVDLLAMVIDRAVEKRRNAERQRQLELQVHHAQKLKAVGTLAAGIAHDFNNLLVPILGLTRNVHQKLDAQSEEAHNLETVLKSAEKAKQLVNQMLLLSTKTPAKCEPCSVENIVGDMLKELRPKMEKSISLQCSFPESLPDVFVDELQIHQMLFDLCNNAYQALEESGKLHIHAEDVGEKDLVDHQGKTIHNHFLRIAIEDNGCGIPTNIFEHIFEPFYTTKQPHGTGLGLPVALSIIEKHEGCIEICSKVGSGTTVFVYLPIAEQQHNTLPNTQTSLPSATNPNILIVDDNEVVLTTLEILLVDLGYTVTTAKNGEEALKAFRENPQLFCLVITDYTMPQMKGDKLARELKKIRVDVPILLCSGYAIDLDIEACGISAILSKPFSLEELEEKISTAVDKK